MRYDKERNEFLLATPLIDADHPEIGELARKVTAGSRNDRERARDLFLYVRDSVPYSLHISPEKEAYRASAILTRGRGFCTQKAILYTALARSLAMEAGIALYDIIDHTLPDAAAALFGGRRLRRHGIPAVRPANTWIQADCTLDRELALKKDLEPVSFNGDADAFLPARTRGGGPGITYERFYRIVADITWEQIQRWYFQYGTKRM